MGFLHSTTQNINSSSPKGYPMHLPASTGMRHHGHVATHGKRQLFFPY